MNTIAIRHEVRTIDPATNEVVKVERVAGEWDKRFGSDQLPEAVHERFVAALDRTKLVQVVYLHGGRIIREQEAY